MSAHATTPTTDAGSPAGLRTDERFWDAQWQERDSRSAVQRLLHGRDFGRGGAFLRLMDRHVGLDAFAGARVVELGGASSRFLVDLALHAGADVTAVDYSEVGVAQTRELFRRAGVAGTALLADIFAWDGDGRPFDVVTHWGLLEHFDDPARVLAASARLVRPGGTVVFTMPNLAAVGARLWARTAPENFAKHVFHDDRAVARACTAAGLTLERTFHSGPPLVRMAPPERRSALAVATNAAHVLLCAAGTAVPSLYGRGHPRVANTRGFVARRPR